MGYGFRHGAAGGGAALNFRIVGGTSQPAAARENDLWVNTDAEITGWVISATEPETAAEGTVWIINTAQNEGSFNALKKNSILISPAGAKQYVGSAWADKPLSRYDGTDWIQFQQKVYIIENGTIDLDKYTYSYKLHGYPSSTTGGASDSVIKQSQTYDGKQALWLAGANGYKYDHMFANVEVPTAATKFVVEYYRLCAYKANPVFAVGDAQISIDRGSANYVTNGTAEIDVTALRGQTVTFTASNTGASGNVDNYIGNAWFE